MSRLLLALETATPRTSVALLEGDTLVCEIVAPEGAPTAEVLLPTIDAALAKAGATLDAVAAFALSSGPGSFTSLRIGVATVKGLAFGSDRPAVGIPTLAALAAAAPPGDGPVIAMLDARRGEVYAALHEPGSLTEGALPCSVYDLAALERALPARCRLVGEGAAICGEALQRVLGEGVALHPEVLPRAAWVGRLGARALARGLGRDSAQLLPRYLRRAQAEVVRTGRTLE